MSNTINRSDMTTLISNKTGLPKSDVELVLDSFFSLTISELSRNHVIKISSFGVFQNVKHKSRVINDNVSGELNCSKKIDGRYLPKFKPSNNFKEIINKNVTKLEKAALL